MPVPLDVSGSLHHMNSTLLSSGHWIKEQVCQYTTHDATLYSTVDLSLPLFRAGRPIHFVFSAFSYSIKQTNKKLIFILLLNNSNTSIVKINWGKLNWQSIRIKPGPLLELLSWPPSQTSVQTSYRTYAGWPNTSTTLEKWKGTNIQLLPVFKQRMCIYF